jgi:hypothetical protein
MTIMTNACTNIELIPLSVDESAETYYQHIHLDVELSNSEDTKHFTDNFIKKMSRYDLQVVDLRQQKLTGINDKQSTALLKIYELDRYLKLGEHNQRYGRTSLTQMRGRKKDERIVITLRAIFIDQASGRTMSRTDYIAEGQWFSSSTAVASALAGSLSKQLEYMDFIAVKD